MRWLCLALTACIPGIATTTTATTSTTAPAAVAYDGPGGLFVRDVANMRRGEAEELLHHDGFANVAATGDLDPAYVEDELVCEETPAPGAKVAPSTTVTLRYCNGYRAPKKAPVLVGLSVEAAKQRAKATGLKHPIEVIQLSEFDKDCARDTVCRVSPDYWDIDQDNLVLYVNRTITIAAPSGGQP